MARQSESARVGEALSVAEEYVRIGFQHPRCGEDAGDFAETEQTVHVWEAATDAGDARFDHLARPKIPDHDPGDQALAVARDRQNPCHGPQP